MNEKSARTAEIIATGIQLPRFLTLDWVAANAGNIQPSDIRHISERCAGLVPNWPEGKLSRADFVCQVHRALQVPNGMRVLNGALKKRRLFDPIFDKAKKAVGKAGRSNEFRVRVKSPTANVEDLTAFVAESVRTQEEPEFLKEFTLVAVLREHLTVEAINWGEDSPEWEELVAYLREYRSNDGRSESEEEAKCTIDSADAAADCPATESEADDRSQVLTAWREEWEFLSSVREPETPETSLALRILETAQKLVVLAERYDKLRDTQTDAVRDALTNLLQASPDDGEAFDQVRFRSLHGYALEQSFTREEADLITGIASRLAALADDWKREHEVHQTAVREYLAAAVTERAQFDLPMRNSQARLVEIKSESETLTGDLVDLLRPPHRRDQSELPNQLAETVPSKSPPDVDEDSNKSKDSLVGVEERGAENALSTPTDEFDSVPENAIEAQRTVNELSARGRHALTSLTADALAVLYPASVGEIDTAIYKLLALATAAQEVVDVPPEPLTDCCLSLGSRIGELNWNAGSSDRARLLYLLSGLLFPSLFLPASMARNVVKQQILGRFGSAAPLHRLVSHLSEVDRFGGVLVPEVLSKTDQQEFWTKRLALLQQTAEDWKNNEEIYHGFGNFRPAEHAWTAIVDPHRGTIGKIMRTFAATGARAFDQIKSAVEALRQSSIEDLIEQSGAPRLAQKFEGRARSHLQHNIEASVAFLERCMRHLHRGPDRSGRDANSGLEHFVVELRDRVTHALKFLAQHEVGADVERAGLSVAKEALSKLERLFTQYEAPSLDMSLDRWFGRELLLVQGIRFSGGWTPDPSDEQSLLEGASGLASEAATSLADGLNKAFDEHLKAESHIQTGRILVELEGLALSKPELAIKQTRRDEEVRDLRAELLQLQAAARDRINMAIALNLINDVEKRALESRVRGIKVERLPIMDLKVEDIVLEQRGRGTVVADFPAARDTLIGVERQLDEKFETVRAQLTANVDALAAEGRAKPVAVDRIRKLLDAQDIVTVNEYLRLLRDGEDLPRDTRVNSTLHDYMQRFLPNLERAFSANRQKIVDVALSILRRDAEEMPGVFEVQVMTAAQREDATRMLEAWRDIRSSQNIEDAVERLFVGGLSFDVKQIDDLKEKGGRLFRYYLSSSRLVVPDGFLVPLFGSEADGNYLVEVLRGQVKTTELFQNMQAEASKQRATFHLYTSILGSADRAELAHRAHNRGYQGLVLDDALVAYLAFIQDNRLTAMFRIASAFIKYNPYNEITPLPPEMFYGRSEQRDQIVSRRGGSLVFGGRRLGKSSLLRDVERKVHSPKKTCS